MTPEKKSTTCLAMDGRPELKELLQQASQALALLDCARLEELAKADRRTLSNYILKVLYDHIDAIEMSRDKPRK